MNTIDLLINFFAVYFTVILLFWIVLYSILTWAVYTLAAKNGRSIVFWILVSIFILSPLLALVVLYLVGKTEEKSKEDYILKLEIQESWLKSRRNDFKKETEKIIFESNDGEERKIINDIYRR